MKKASWIAALLLLSAGVLAERLGSRARPVDDPPPEPVTCPLCGGNPQLHFLRTFAIVSAGERAAALALRW